MHPIIIIGTGLAGYQAAREFRKLDSLTPLMLITADDGRFYSKPLLSTALTNKKDFTSLTTSTAETMAAQLNATILTHSEVTAIHPDKQALTLKNGDEIVYEKLVLACGADIIKPSLTGNAANEVVSVNHIFHYAEFQKLLQNKKHITILGAGLIGCEFANDLSNAGYEVHIVALGKSPLDLLIPEKIGVILQAALEKNGVHFHLECTVKQIDKDSVFQLTLSNDEKLQTELVLSAIGLRPHVTLASTAHLVINRGIVVNRYLETSVKNIYALGDCAEVEGHVLPFITPLLNASRALGKTLANGRTAVDYPAMPVTVKTPAHPLVICPPPKGMPGDWKIDLQGKNVRALFYNEQSQLYGFILTNDAVKERMTLVKQIPGLF